MTRPKNHAIPLLATIIAAAFIIPFGAHAETGSPVDINGGFEEDTDSNGWPDGWTSSGAGCTFARDSDAYEGDYSMAQTRSDSGNCRLLSVQTTASVGDVFDVSARMKSDAADARALISLTFFDSNGNDLGSFGTYTGSTYTTTWVSIYGTGTAPLGSATVSVDFDGSFADGDTVYLDKVRLIANT